MKSKYKKVVQQTDDAAVNRKHAPLHIVISSDGNELEFVSYNGGIYTYKYIVSNTKLGTTVSFTEDHFHTFLLRNQQIQSVPFEKYVAKKRKIKHL